MKCKICQKYCESIRSLSLHLKYFHDLKLIKYFIDYEDFQVPKCKYCNDNAKIVRGLKYRVTCGSLQCISTDLKQRKHSDKTKEILRKKRFNYLKKKNKNTSWQTHHRREMSYLENWFYENIVKEYNLCEKYDIIYEYPFYPYFIDFAFLNIKLAVELDGGTHFKKNGDRIQRDLDKNKLLLNNGWSILRINYQESNENKIQEFLNFLKNIDILNPKVLQSKIFKGSIRKITNKNHLSKNEYLKKIKKESFIREERNIEIVNKSDIDFSKYGWRKKIAKLINKHPQKIQNWMRKYCPDIWKKAHKTKRAKDYFKL